MMMKRYANVLFILSFLSTSTQSPSGASASSTRRKNSFRCLPYPSNRRVQCSNATACVCGLGCCLELVSVRRATSRRVVLTRRKARLRGSRVIDNLASLIDVSLRPYRIYSRDRPLGSKCVERLISRASQAVNRWWWY